MTNTLYLDMDGVVADWDLTSAKILGGDLRTRAIDGHYKNTPDEWSIIAQQERLYRHMPIMPLGQELVDLAREYRDKLGWQLKFLTAVPKNDDMPWAFYDKCMWALERFPDIAVMFGPHSTDKWRHCQPGDILVDDRSDNCASWIGAGGMAVHVQGRDLRVYIEELRWDLNRRMSMRSMAALNDMADRLVASGGFNVGNSSASSH